MVSVDLLQASAGVYQSPLGVRPRQVYSPCNESLMVTLATVYLAWSLAHCCPLVNGYRERGYSDVAIERIARDAGVPEWIIRYAKRHCARP